MSIVRKITTKVVCGKPDKKEIINSDGTPIWLFTVYGSAHRMIPGESEYGPFIKFRGSFEAINPKSGEVFNSMNLLLPPIAEELIEEGLSVEGTTAVEVALNIGVRRDDSVATGYVYVAESVHKSESGDPLQRLRLELQEAKIIPSSESEP
jgi:hypothetical protein